MDVFEQVKETLLDKGYSETGALTQMWWRGLFPNLLVYDPSILPMYVDEKYVNELKQKQINRERESREKLAREFLIEINFMRPQWNNPYAQY